MNASLYDELYRVEQTHWWFRARRQIVWSLVGRYMGGASENRLKICELGCGTGGNLAEVADKHDVIGVECSPQAIAYAKLRLGDRVRHGHLPDNVDLPRASFDVVLLTDVLEHVEDDTASARTALKLLRPGGIVVATVPAYQWLYSPRDAQHHHFRRYSRQRFAKLWPAASADTLLLSHYNTLLFPPAAAVRLFEKLVPPRGTSGDLAATDGYVNKVLTQIMASERNLLGRLPLPCGLSLIAVARKLETAAMARPALAA